MNLKKLMKEGKIMKNTEKVLADIKNQTGMDIINESREGIPLFKIPSRQPFKFDLEISYSSIKGRCSFELHFPSLYVKANDVRDFSNEVNFITFLIDNLNKAIKKDYSEEWVLQ